MPPKKSKENVRSKRKYTQQNLTDAVNAVRNKTLSLRKSAKYFGVPVMTIQNRVSGLIDDTASPGRPTVIPAEVEDLLVSKIKTATLQGFGLTRRMLAIRVARLVKRFQFKNYI